MPRPANSYASAILSEPGREKEEPLTMRTEIQIETHELTVIRFTRGRSSFFRCSKCDSESAHVTTAHAAEILRIDESAVSRLTIRGDLHSSESGDGTVLICANSALTQTNKHLSQEISDEKK